MRFSPLACSGLMYSAVPTVIPVPVIADPLAAVPLSNRTFAMPKSLTIACPRDSRMLPGLMSR